MQFLSREQLEVCAQDQLDELEQELLVKHPHWAGGRWAFVSRDSPHYGEFREIMDASPWGLMLRTAKDLQRGEASTGISASKCGPSAMHQRSNCWLESILPACPAGLT